MAEPLHPRRLSPGTIERWVNEGGSRAPDGGAAVPDLPSPGADPVREARDTVTGCRDQAAKDRLQAAGADTANGRQVLERSAASWDKRADDLAEGDQSIDQKAADRALWASEEEDEGDSPD